MFEKSVCEVNEKLVDHGTVRHASIQMMSMTSYIYYHKNYDVTSILK